MDDKQLALLIFKAIHALGIDVPIMGVVLLPGDRIQLALYGGRVVVYPPQVDHPPVDNADPGDTAAIPDPAASKVAVAAVETMAPEPAMPPASRRGMHATTRRQVWPAPDREILGSDIASSKKKLRTVTPEVAMVDGFSPPQGAPLSTTGLLEPDPVGLPAEREIPATSDIASYNHPAVRDLEAMETSTLRDLAQRKGIKVTRKMNRDALIIALRGVK